MLIYYYKKGYYYVIIYLYISTKIFILICNYIFNVLSKNVLHHYVIICIYMIVCYYKNIYYYVTIYLYGNILSKTIYCAVM